MSEENTSPPEILRKVRETQGHRMKEFLKSLLDQDFEPNSRPKSPCKSPKLDKIVDKQKAQQASKHKAPNSVSNQERQATTNDNIPLTVRKMQAQAAKTAQTHNRHIGQLT